MPEVVTLEEQGQVQRTRESVSSAIPQIELRRMARTPAKPLISIKGYCRLICIEGKDVDVEILKEHLEFVEASSGKAA